MSIEFRPQGTHIPMIKYKDNIQGNNVSLNVFKDDIFSGIYTSDSSCVWEPILNYLRWTLRDFAWYSCITNQNSTQNEFLGFGPFKDQIQNKVNVKYCSLISNLWRRFDQITLFIFCIWLINCVFNFLIVDRSIYQMRK